MLLPLRRCLHSLPGCRQNPPAYRGYRCGHPPANGWQTLRVALIASWASDPPHQLRDPLHRDLDLVEARRVAATHETLAARSERVAGDDRDFFLAQEPHRKLVARQPRARDLRK